MPFRCVLIFFLTLSLATAVLASPLPVSRRTESHTPSLPTPPKSLLARESPPPSDFSQQTRAQVSTNLNPEGANVPGRYNEIWPQIPVYRSDSAPGPALSNLVIYSYPEEAYMPKGGPPERADPAKPRAGLSVPGLEHIPQTSRNIKWAGFRLAEIHKKVYRAGSGCMTCHNGKRKCVRPMPGKPCDTCGNHYDCKYQAINLNRLDAKRGAIRCDPCATLSKLTGAKCEGGDIIKGGPCTQCFADPSSCTYSQVYHIGRVNQPPVPRYSRSKNPGGGKKAGRRVSPIPQGAKKAGRRAGRRADQEASQVAGPSTLSRRSPLADQDMARSLTGEEGTTRMTKIRRT